MRTYFMCLYSSLEMGPSLEDLKIKLNEQCHLSFLALSISCDIVMSSHGPQQTSLHSSVHNTLCCMFLRTAAISFGTKLQSK